MIREPGIIGFPTSADWGEALKLCDGAITTNHYLAAKIAKFSGLPVRVVPNFMNKEQLGYSDDLFRGKETSGIQRDDKIHLGYFSGSPSHKLDYAIIEPALEQVLAKDPRVEVMVVGYIESGPALRKFGNRVNRQPFQDYVNLQRLISSVEFNLMPLQSNDFTNCKSELKYFEAAVVGALSIASPSHTYASAIRDGENGYIAKAHEWLSVIEGAIRTCQRIVTWLKTRTRMLARSMRGSIKEKIFSKRCILTKENQRLFLSFLSTPLRESRMRPCNLRGRTRTSEAKFILRGSFRGLECFIDRDSMNHDSAQSHVTGIVAIVVTYQPDWGPPSRNYPGRGAPD